MEDILKSTFEFVYALDKSTGEHTERSLRRKGSKLQFDLLRTGISAIIAYKDGSGSLVTSTVEEIIEYSDGSLRVETMNTFYMFQLVE